jgi:hypothetical protein
MLIARKLRRAATIFWGIFDKHDVSSADSTSVFRSEPGIYEGYSCMLTTSVHRSRVDVR